MNRNIIPNKNPTDAEIIADLKVQRIVLVFLLLGLMAVVFFNSYNLASEGRPKGVLSTHGSATIK